MVLKWIVSLLMMAVPFGLLASIGFEGLQRLIRGINNMPATLKRVVFPFIATAVVAVGQFAGVNLVCEVGTNCLETLDVGVLETVIRGIAAAAFGFLTHFAYKKGR